MSIFSSPFEAMRNLIATTQAFKDWVGAANDAQAVTHVHYHTYPETPVVPLVVIAEPPDDDAVFEAEQTALTHFWGRHVFNLQFLKDYDESGDQSQQMMTLLEELGDVVSEMSARANSGETSTLGPISTGKAVSRSSVEVSHPDDYEEETEFKRYITMKITWSAEGPSSNL